MIQNQQMQIHPKDYTDYKERVHVRAIHIRENFKLR